MTHSIEEWRDVVGYAGVYQISSFGRVKSFAWTKPRFLSQSTHKRGYKRVTLYQSGRGRSYLVHTLVLEAFDSLRLPDHEVNHKDGDTGNHHRGNLEWVTSSGNKQHAFAMSLKHGLKGTANANAKLDDAKVREIFEAKGSQREIAAQFGINQALVWRIKAGKAWRHLTM